MFPNKSLTRNADKNTKRGWSLLSISSEPSLFLNVQVDGVMMQSVVILSKLTAIRIGEMLVHLGMSVYPECESFSQDEDRVWDGRHILSDDRDLYRVELPTRFAMRVLEKVNGLLEEGDRFRIVMGIGIQERDYHQKGTALAGGDSEGVVIEGGNGRYAIVTMEGTAMLYEMDVLIGVTDEIGVQALFTAMDWISFDPISDVLQR